MVTYLVSAMGLPFITGWAEEECHDRMKRATLHMMTDRVHTAVLFRLLIS